MVQEPKQSSKRSAPFQPRRGANEPRQLPAALELMNLVSCQRPCAWREAWARALRPLGSGPLSSAPLLVGRQATACPAGAAPAEAPGMLPAAGAARRERGRTRRPLWALRGGGSNAAGARRHFAGDARERSPVPEEERCSDSPCASLLMLRRRCWCPGMQCLASVRVTKGDAAVLPGSHLS